MLADARAAAQCVRCHGQRRKSLREEGSAFYRRVFDKYQEIAAREPLRVVVIDGDGSIDEVHQRVVRLVKERLAATGMLR